jgi:hypothetical protein
VPSLRNVSYLAFSMITGPLKFLPLTLSFTLTVHTPLSPSHRSNTSTRSVKTLSIATSAHVGPTGRARLTHRLSSNCHVARQPLFAHEFRARVPYPSLHRLQNRATFSHNGACAAGLLHEHFSQPPQAAVKSFGTKKNVQESMSRLLSLTASPYCSVESSFLCCRVCEG